MTPTSLITRATLDGVAQIYETGILPADPDACVLWDCMQVAGCEVLALEVKGLEQGSVLHRWIVLDAIESAETVPQGAEDKATIAATKAWVADPSEENREAAYYAAEAPILASSATSAIYATYATYAAAASSSSSAYGSFPSASDAAAYASYAASASYAIADAAAYYAARNAARLRFRVLATMAQAGVLPNPLEAAP